MITYYFPPSAEVGAQRPFQFSKYLPEFGWNPIVLTVEPEKYRDEQRVDWKSLNKIPRGILIHRTGIIRPARSITKWGKRLIGIGRNGVHKKSKESPLSENHGGGDKKGLIGRMSDLIDLLFATPDEEVGWLPFAVVEGIKLIVKNQIDVIYTTSPPHSTHLIGYFLKHLTGGHWVVDLQDPWVLSPWRTFHNKLHKAVCSYMERRILIMADKLIFNTEHAMGKYIAHYGGILKHKSCSIPNGFDPDDFADLDRKRKEENSNKLTITHAGTLYKKRNPFPLVEAIYRLNQWGILNSNNFHLYLIGRATMERDLKAKIQALKLNKLIDLVPPMPHRDCLKYMLDSKVLLLIQPETELQVPAKLYEYIYLGKPVLAITEPNGAAAGLIRKYHLGIVVSNSAEDISSALMKLYRDLREKKLTYNSSDLPLQIYNARNLTKRFSQVLKECLT